MNTTIFIVIILLNIPVYWILGKSFFKDWEGFFEALIATITGGSDFDGGESKIDRFTFLFFLVTIVSLTAAEYHVVAKFMFGIEKPWS